MPSQIINDSSFDSLVLKSPLPVLVDFWAPWCGPCRIMGPILEDIARDYEGKLIVGKLNVDDNIETSSKFNIMSIPTIKFFKNGKIVDEMVGAGPRQVLEDKIKRLLATS